MERAAGGNSGVSARARARQAEFATWLANRKEAGRSIDAASCRICLRYAQNFDPYGLYPPSREGRNREWFVDGPESRGSVWIGDLPDDKREVVFARIKAGDIVDDDIPF